MFMMSLLPRRLLCSRQPFCLMSRILPGGCINKCYVVQRSYSSDESQSFYGSFRKNLQLMKEEFVTKLKSPNLDTMFDRSRILWQYTGPESLKDFKLITDKDIGGGSTAELAISRNNKLLFQGNLNTDIPRDGQTVRSGYCALRTLNKYGSFNRKLQIDLTPFNMLHLRIKGDGRAYMVNIYTHSYFSLTHDDVWSYFMFTRGGPYWQTVNIPFAKFFLSSKGRVQDKQSPVDLERVTAFGLTMADAINGEFTLELDSISASYDATETEEFVYEEYRQS